MADRFIIEDISSADKPLTRAEKLKAGLLSVEDLDDEEIINGVVRQEDGRLPSRRNKTLPREMHDEFKRRFFARGIELMQTGLFPAIRALISIIESEDASNADRINASKFMIERVMGKEVTVKIKPEDPVAALFRGVLESDDGLEDAPLVVSGETYDEDD